MPALRPLPEIALEASRTAMLVAVRAADLTMVVVIESLWRAVVLGTGEDGTGCASRRRGSGLGFAGSSAGGMPHGPTAGGGVSYWPRRRGAGVGGGASCCTWPPPARPISTP